MNERGLVAAIIDWFMNVLFRLAVSELMSVLELITTLLKASSDAGTRFMPPVFIFSAFGNILQSYAIPQISSLIIFAAVSPMCRRLLVSSDFLYAYQCSVRISSPV